MKRNQNFLQRTEIEAERKRTSDTGSREDGWSRFEATGAVKDYLYYTACAKEQTGKFQ